MFETIEQSALEVMETIRPQEPERIGSPSKGDVVRQGDLYLVCLGDDFESDSKQIENRQLVPGTTQGSRHVLQGDVTVWEDNPLTEYHSALRGPSFKCNSEGTVTHPEHGDKILPPGSSWACVYQRVHADEVRRTQD